MPTQVEAGLHFQKVDGDLELIPGIPNPDEKPFLERPLVNAENLTITDDGRIFVTGSLEVYEIVKDKKENKKETYHLQEISIDTSGISQYYFRNGIKAYGNSLYLACAHIHKDEKSLFPNLLGDIRKIEQNWSGLFLLGFAQGVYQVESYILRADLKSQDPLKTKFTEEKLIPGKCFANGLDSDEKGNFYVANSLPNFIKNDNFFKVLPSRNSEEIKVEPVVFSNQNYYPPNGLKIRGDYVYYTCLHWLPVMTASLERIKINEKGDFGKTEVIYQSHFSVFDDFDIVDNGNGFVIANIMNIPDFGAGSLLFVTTHRDLNGDLKGELKSIFRDNGLKSPSSVKVVNQNINGSAFFKAGDIVITEKGRHCVSRLRPNDEWRQWLVG